ncbi:MAG TPA: hypothetical protein VMA34_03750 [Terracidiphilus sp.]|nr:hypothetical protein [Terracidiphilus sp.]
MARYAKLAPIRLHLELRKLDRETDILMRRAAAFIGNSSVDDSHPETMNPPARQAVATPRHTIPLQWPRRDKTTREIRGIGISGPEFALGDSQRVAHEAAIAAREAFCVAAEVQ